MNFKLVFRLAGKTLLVEAASMLFPLAVALTAMDGLSGAAGEGDVSSFSAGEVSIQLREQSGGGRREQAERLLAPWLRETGFAFRGVEG